MRVINPIGLRTVPILIDYETKALGVFLTRQIQSHRANQRYTPPQPESDTARQKREGARDRWVPRTIL